MQQPNISESKVKRKGHVPAITQVYVPVGDSVIGVNKIVARKKGTTSLQHVSDKRERIERNAYREYSSRGNLYPLMTNCGEDDVCVNNPLTPALE